MSLIDVIYSDLGSGIYTVNRYAERVYGTDGKLLPRGAATPLTITASVQPTQGRDLDVLVDVAETNEGRTIYTDTLLFPRRPGQEPDEIIIDGEVWVIYTAKRWQGLGIEFYVSLAARRDLT